MKSQIVIGATNSGCGKTTLTMGLLRVLKRRGLLVQPFKCGPDYIDTQFHTLASGSQSVNLDTWMASEEHVREVYNRYGADSDVCVTEGVMGLFDGYDRMKGSTAEIAMLIKVPVVLVVNASSTAYSVAALLFGFKHFHPQLNVVGVVFNQVSSESHYRFLEEACREVGIVSLGYMPKNEGIRVPSRHLGLTLMVKRKMESLIEEVADMVQAYVDVDRLLEITSVSFTILPEKDNLRRKPMKIAVAYDAAFNFVFRENIDGLKKQGTVSFFSPLKDKHLPIADWVYLPGGYPELFASRLQRNKQLMEEIKTYAERDGKILAECGGMMFLTQSIVTDKRKEYPMCGVLPFKSTMSQAHLHLGYRSMDMQGETWKGHEFHYSELENPEALPSMAKLKNAKGKEVDTSIYRYKNVIAGYTHWYWGEKDIFKLWENNGTDIY